LSRTYVGPVARIGPNEISFAAPAAGRTIFKTGQGFHKTDFYTVFLPNNIKDIFTEIREDVHATKKRYTVPPYSLASVQQHTTQIEALMLKFLRKLDDFAYQGVACDLGKWLHYLAFDVSNTHLCPVLRYQPWNVQAAYFFSV